MLSKDFGLSRPLDVFAFLQPEFRPEISDFYSHEKYPSPDTIASSVFADPGMTRGWAENVRRLKALSPEAYESARSDATLRPIVAADFYFLSPGRPRPVKLTLGTRSGNFLPKLKERHSLFSRFIDSNFKVLQDMAALAGTPTRAAGEKILAGTRALGGLFGRIRPSEPVIAKLDRLERELREGWASLQPDDPLPESLKNKVFRLSPEHPGASLHSLVNWMHQEALSFFKFEAPQAGSVTGTVVMRGGQVGLIYLGDEPVHSVLARSSALKGYLAELPLTGSAFDTVFFDETRIWIHATFGAHSAEIFLDGSDPDEGGMLRIRYKESGCYGSLQRMYAIESFLRLFGISVKLEGQDYLEAVWDKDHGLSSPHALEEALPRILRMLHDTRDLDLLFGNLLDFHPGDLDRMARSMGEAYFAEGLWPFDVAGREEDQFDRMKDYLERSPERSAQRARIDAELARRGLPPIPSELPFGRTTTELFHTRPILEAEGLKGFSLDEPPRDAGMASILNSLDPSWLQFEPVGLVGGLRAESARRWLDDGSLLTVFALRDVSSGRLAFAQASAADKPLDKAGLERLIWANGQSLDDVEAFTPSQMERLSALLRRSIPPESASASGMAASPGTAAGPVTFDRAHPAQGAILAVPYTTPDDLEAISRSAGVITTGGGALSHAAITTRELGLPSVILPSARWTKEGLEAGFLGRGPVRVLAGGIEVCELSADRAILREGDFVFIDGRTGRLSLSAEASKPEPPKARPVQAKAPEIDRSRAEEVRRKEPSVLRLDEIDGSLTPFVGGKAAKLGEMTSVVESHVPGGIALTHWAFERFLKENGIESPDRKSILSGRLDPDRGVGREILDALGTGRLWAVRSSAIQEDSEDAAFAGAAESYLFVKPGDILAKVVENWASFWLPRGILYRRRHGLDASGIVPATLIQEMVPAEISGVIFTRNPVTSEDEIVIDAVYGLGEGAVSGQADPDQYTTRKSDGEETALPRVARKRRQVTEAGLVPVEWKSRSKRALSREQTRELSALAVKLEGHFGLPLDIEFSIHGEKIAILQARPITTP